MGEGGRAERPSPFIPLEHHEHFTITDDENIVCSFYSSLKPFLLVFVFVCFYCSLGSTDLGPSWHGGGQLSH